MVSIELECDYIVTAGILHMACHFYKKVLSMEPECSLPEVSGS